MVTRPCAVCAVEYKAKTTRSIYCSQRCRDKGKSKVTCYICGLAMSSGRNLGQQGKAAHNKCRSQLPSPENAYGSYTRRAQCPVCLSGFEASGDGDTTCSAACDRFTATGWSASRELVIWCPPKPEQWWEVAIRHLQTRLRRFVVPAEFRSAIYQRDNHTCQICMNPVDMSLPFHDAWAATLDHIVPRSLAKVPDHGPNNLRLAHRTCNSRRGNRVEEELRAA